MRTPAMKKMVIGLSACSLLALISVPAAAGFLDKLASPGTVSEIQKRAGQATRVVKAVRKSTAEITPEQEYYIGRAVAATILKQYRPWDNPAANAYLNKVGQALALVSDQPETFGGYHFLALDSDEINAFAAPGGLILVSRGLLRCCKSEDELAAVLAHEIGHVQLKHGLGAIKKSRLMDLGGMLVKEGIKEFSSSQVRQLTQIFGESVGDITKTLMINGYSRTQESEADAAAVVLLRRMGYQPAGLIVMLKKMKANYPKDAVGFAKTHPDPLDRVRDVQPKVGGAAFNPPAVRVQRFEKTLSNV